MKHPQVLNINSADSSKDTHIAIDGNSVVRDSDQATMGITVGETSISVDVILWNVTTGASAGTVFGITMTYRSGPDIWTLNISDISGSLLDRNKYVALITENGGSVMRDFKLNEFSVDNSSFENVWMRLPYEIKITPSPARIVWYSDNIGGTAVFQANVYQGGTGTTEATSAETVTHRGAIEPV